MTGLEIFGLCLACFFLGAACVATLVANVERHEEARREREDRR